VESNFVQDYGGKEAIDFFEELGSHVAGRGYVSAGRKHEQ